MAESPCPDCKQPVNHDEGRLVGQTATLDWWGGTLRERKTREAECPHCGKRIIRAESDDAAAVWHRNSRPR